MAQQGKVLATKPDEQSLISGPHTVKEERTDFFKIFSACDTMACMVHIHSHTQIKV